MIAIGSNRSSVDGETSASLCDRAVGAIASLAAVRVEAVSRWYRSAAIPDGSGPDYVNGCLRVATGLDPMTLLIRLQGIEAAFGRTRTQRDAPRTLDLDIIGMGGLVRASPDPVLPHPRAHVRAFVLRPLADIWPGWRHPILGRTAEELLAALPWQAIEPLADDRLP